MKLNCEPARLPLSQGTVHCVTQDAMTSLCIVMRWRDADNWPTSVKGGLIFEATYVDGRPLIGRPDIFSPNMKLMHINTQPSRSNCILHHYDYLTLFVDNIFDICFIFVNKFLIVFGTRLYRPSLPPERQPMLPRRRPQPSKTLPTQLMTG